MTRRPTPLRRVAAIGAAAAVSLTIVAAQQATAAATPAATVTILVAAHGEPGQADFVVHNLHAAQALAAATAKTSDVVVELAGGTYELARPLRFDAADGGQGSHSVTWTSLPGQKATLSGGSPVTGWTLHDATKNIWVARVPRGSQSRQLYVDGQLAPRTRLQLAADKHSRGSLQFTPNGITLLDPSLGYLANLPNQSSMEIESIGSFTDRFSPVSKIVGNQIVMQQPAWDNNTFGYDTLTAPYANGALYLDNAYAFLDRPNEWYLDSAAGKLYYRSAPGQSPNAMDIVLPRLQSLVQVSGTYDRPVQDLTFRNLGFANTTWLEPGTSQGYVDQQSGAHVVGTYPRPSDWLQSCQNGCPQFEATRNEWHQIPAAVQVSAARGIAFAGDTFSQLGEVGLGIGMDPDANASGIGYGASNVTVSSNRFTNSSASAVVVDGVQPNAHHPSSPAMVDSDITVVDNTIDGVAKDYQDNAAILSTYVTRATISHNSISDLPYDGIDIGWGWGTNDPGGNLYYRNAGLYNYQPIYSTPTTFRDNVVSYNLIHDTKQVMHDGGSVYSLSASPGTVIERNYIYNNHNTFGALIDQGSRYITLRNNVFSGCSDWVYVNSDASNPDTFNTKDNLIIGNWWDVGTSRNPMGPGYNNQMVDNVQVSDGNWPPGAQRVIAEAGAR